MHLSKQQLKGLQRMTVHLFDIQKTELANIFLTKFLPLHFISLLIVTPSKAYSPNLSVTPYPQYEP
jgi:hypothetical protein